MRTPSPRAGTLRSRPVEGFSRTTVETFVPAPLPPDPPLEFTRELHAELTDVRARLAYLEGLAEGLAGGFEVDAFNVRRTSGKAEGRDFLTTFRRMTMLREAGASSVVEGIRADWTALLHPNASEDKEDVAAVGRLVRATELLLEPPFSQNGQNGQNGQDGRAEWIEGSDPWSALLAAHAELFPGDAGAGAFRRELVGVGPRGSSIESAYIPPHPDDVPALMKDLARTDRSGTDPLGPLDPLICAALIHYQFETIHPFRDGNGRLGRALILRELLASGVRAAALIAPSVPILARRGDYYAALTAVRERGDFEGWVRFFLDILGRSADEAVWILRGTRAVRREAEAAVMAVGAGESGRPESASSAAGRRKLAFLDFLEANPVIEIGWAAKALGLSFPTVTALVEAFVEAGVLREVTGRRRSRRFAWVGLVGLWEEGMGGR